MRIFKNAWFEKFVRKEGLADSVLCEAVSRAESGLIDADLGGSVIKQRVARPGAGKSGGYRTIVFFQSGERAVFAFGFAKSDRANLSPEELAFFRKAAKLVLQFSNEQMNAEVQAGRLMEVNCHGQDIQK